jgi:hypothetical protein
MNKKIIIEQPWGGLGDNLQFSTLPELGKKLGYDVYVSNKNVYRNNDIKKLVWDLNPYLCGFTDEGGNMPIEKLKLKNNNIISDIEEWAFGECFNTLPKIYYEPNEIQELSNLYIIDPNYVSRGIDFSNIIRKYDKKETLILNSRFEDYISIMSRDIFHWVDIITSCKRFICQFSGGSVAILAFNKSCDVYMKKRKDNIFIFKKNNYIVI